LPGVESGKAGAVHHARTASRRLRELLPVLEIDPHMARRLGRRLKKTARRLGRVREVDVLAGLIDELRGSPKVPARALKRLTDELGHARGSAKHAASPEDAADDLRRLGRKLAGLLDDLNELDRGRSRSRGWQWAIDARVAHRAAALKAAVRDAGGLYVPERLHQVRLAVKKLRYGIELSSEAAGVKNGADLRLLKREQDLLGRLRDLQVLVERVRRVQAHLTPPDLSAWHDLDAVVSALDAQCRRLHARYVRDRAALIALSDRLGARTATSAARRAG
jgi:CHAD domain-containing protein